MAVIKPDVSTDNLLFCGSLPAIFSENRDPVRAYQNYYETYVERDLRALINIKDLSLFRKFLKLCAGRVGQQFNASQLANETGVAVNTIKSWTSVLETSFILYLLPPWYDNISKRLVKSPKLYFYDVGLATYLLGFRNAEQVQRDPLRGSLFENFVINEIKKKYFNRGLEPELYYYRDKHGNEVDALLLHARNFIPIEIKSSETFHREFLKNLSYFQKLYPDRIPDHPILVYDGREETSVGNINLLNYRNLYNNLR